MNGRRGRPVRRAMLALGLFAVGCARSSYHSAAGAASPSLSSEQPHHKRDESNPNAPFTIVDRTPHPAGAASSTSQSDAPACNADDLDLTEVAAQVDGNARSLSLAFVNNGAAACKISGYPSISLLNGSGKPLGAFSVKQVADAGPPGQPLGPQLAPATAAPPTPSAAGLPATAAGLTGHGSPDTAAIVMAPEGEAYFGIAWMSGENCPAVARLGIGMPGSIQTFTVNRALTVCSGEVRVSALRSLQNGG